MCCAGVVGPVPGLIGVLQAVEVIKLLVKSRPTATQVSHSSKFKNLIGRQLYYDAASAEFHEFGLPKRNPECISCKHLYTSSSLDREVSISTLFPTDVDGVEVQPCPVPQQAIGLSSAHRVNALEYFNSVLDAGLPHILLDVRSALQFSMISLMPLFPACKSKSKLLNIPFALLLASSSDEKCVNDVALQPLKDAMIPESGKSPVPVYVLCRRGVDSVKATQLLLRINESLLGLEKWAIDEQRQVFNIDGGLNAWHSQVDTAFPKY